MANISQFFGSGLINLGADDIDSAISSKVIPAINYAVAFSALVAILLIVVSAYTLITSTGNPDQIAKGQKGLVAAIVGMVIVFLARAIVIFVVKFIG